MNLAHLVITFLKERLRADKIVASVYYNEDKLRIEVSVLLKNAAKFYVDEDGLMCWSRWNATRKSNHLGCIMDFRERKAFKIQAYDPEFFEKIYKVTCICLNRDCDNCPMSEYIEVTS